MMGFYNYDYGFGHMLGLGWIFSLVFWALVIWAIVAFVRSLGYGHRHCRHCHHHGHHEHHHEGGEEKDNGSRALDILKERYAKGDISKEEYQEKKEELIK